MADTGVLNHGALPSNLLSKHHRGSVATLHNLESGFRTLSSMFHHEDGNHPDAHKLRLEAMELSRESREAFVTVNAEECCKLLHTHPKQGLSEAEAARRLEHHGPNKLETPPPRHWFWILCDQFKDLLVILLVIACGLSFGLGQYAAATTIVVIVGANAALGTVQEYRAGQALDDLATSTKPEVTVIRGGRPITVATEDLVPGDVVQLPTGCVVPADVRLISHTKPLKLNESNLTGESALVDKDHSWTGSLAIKTDLSEHLGDTKSSEPGTHQRHGSYQPAASLPNAAGEEKEDEGKDVDRTSIEPNFLVMDSTIGMGQAVGVVTQTGMDTEMGHIWEKSTQGKDDDSPLQAKLERLGVRLGVASIAVSILVFIIGVASERGADPNSDEPVWLQMLLVAVSLTVAAVPEGLPACVTVTLALGMNHMANHKCFINKLKSVETLGSASVVCSDKTGTLTEGRMTAIRLQTSGRRLRITGGGYSPEGYVIPEDFVARTHGLGDEKSNANQLPTATPKFNKRVSAGQAEANRLNDQYSKAARDFVTASNPKETNGWTQYFNTILAGVLACGKDIALEFDKGQQKWLAYGNTTERTLVVAARKVGIEVGKDAAVPGFTRLFTNLFTSDRKMMSVFYQCNVGGLGNGAGAFFSQQAPYAAFVKGAPNFIFDRCNRYMHVDPVTGRAEVRNMDEQQLAMLNRVNDEWCDDALRVLAIAYRPFERPVDEDEGGPDVLENGLVYVGMVGIQDPPRSTVPSAITKAFGAGVRIIMITGDHIKTAVAISKRLSILEEGADVSRKAMLCHPISEIANKMKALEARAKELKDQKKNASKSEKEAISRELDIIEQRTEETWVVLDEITRRVDVYARALPDDKFYIVQSLKRQGAITAMTGDGVNDAMALKNSSIGMAMGSGTDVAKHAAHMIIQDDDFSHIIDAIEEGRIIYANITKFCYFLLSTNVAEVFLILIAVIMGVQSPLVPIQILWLNLVTDGAPAIALALETVEPGVMQEGPRPPEENIIEKVMITGITIQTIVLTALTLGTFLLGLHWEVGSWDGTNDALTDDKLDYGVRRARTMCILLIVAAELMRAYGARSLRQSMFAMNTNKYMHWAVGTAVVGTAIVTNVPGVMDVFGVEYLSGREYAWLAGTFLIPLVVDEITKYVYRRTGFGERPRSTFRSDVTGAGGPAGAGGEAVELTRMPSAASAPSTSTGHGMATLQVSGNTAVVHSPAHQVTTRFDFLHGLPSEINKARV